MWRQLAVCLLARHRICYTVYLWGWASGEGRRPVRPLRVLPQTLRRERHQSSSLMSDIDRVWQSPRRPSGDPLVLRVAADLRPDRAARELLSKMPHGETDLTLAQRLEVIGVALGRLSPSSAPRASAKALWRSTLPVVLVADRQTRGFSKAHDVAEQIGFLLYGSRLDIHGVPDATVFADAFERAFLDVWPSTQARRRRTKKALT